jgi:lysozyme
VARKRRKSGGQRRGWTRALLVLLLLGGLAAAGWWYWTSRHWRPSESRYPEQGVLVGEGDGTVHFDVIKGLGGDFAYLEASRGGKGRDKAFAANLAAARAAGLQVGAVHVFDPCVPADAQSANFIVVVPREKSLLPPAILMEDDAGFCPTPVSEAAIQSELMTLVNQIEAHSGKPVILAPNAEFERKYRVGGRIERNLWLTRELAEPTYAGRPWTLWTANAHLHTDAAEAPLRWVVARP